MARSRNTADTQTASGGPVSPSIAGKNAVINGGMDIWQRGTSTTTTTASYVSADRWATWINAGSGTLSQDTVNVPSDIRYGLKFTTSTSSSSCNFYHTIETANTIPFVNKTVTLSAYLSGTSGLTLQMGLLYSTTTDAAFNTFFTTISAPSYTLTTTPTRYSFSVTVPSNAKTLQVFFGTGTIATSSNYVSITGVQLEVGSVATPFSRAGGTIQGELAACQRYYYRAGDGTQTYPLVAPSGIISNSTSCGGYITMPVRMRALPTAADYSNLFIQDTAFNTFVVSSISIDTATFGGNTLGINFFSTGMTGGRFVRILGNNSTSAYLALSAEL